MSSISDRLLSKLRRNLAACCQAEFYTDQALKAIFLRQSLNAYKDSLPQATNLQERIDFLIDFLSGAKQQGKFVLVAFLEAMVERQPEETDCRAILQELAQELELELEAGGAIQNNTGPSPKTELSSLPNGSNSNLQGYSVMPTNKGGNNNPNGKDSGLSINIEPGTNFTNFGNIVSGHNNKVTATNTGVTYNYNNANSQASTTKKERLVQLVAQLQAELAKAPPNYRVEAGEVGEQARKLLAEANQQPKPNKTELKIRSQVFLEEANNLASVLPPVAGSITAEIVELVGSLVL
jgi:hypothetical protein